MASGARPPVARGLYQKNLKKKRAVCVPGDRAKLGNRAKLHGERGDRFESKHAGIDRNCGRVSARLPKSPRLRKSAITGPPKGDRRVGHEHNGLISIPTNEADVLCDERVVTNSFQNPGSVQLDFRSLQDFGSLQSK